MASTDTSAKESGGLLARMGRHSDVVVGVLLIVICIATIVESRGFPATAVGTDIGAGAFPTAFACILIALCLLQIFDHFAHTGRPAEEGNADVEGAAATGTRPNYLAPFFGVVLTVLYVSLIHWAGYLVSTPIYMFVLLRVIKFRARMASVFIALGVTIALYLVFDVGMGVALPSGEFFD